MINQRQIEAFRAVMVAGGITTAAAAMRISQPAVSRLIRDLEARIGVTLFERRTGGRLRPTADAAALFLDVERYFVGLEQIDQSAAGLRRHSRGSLRVASLPALYVNWLPRFIGRFLAQRPDLNIELIGNSSEAIIELISSGRCDIGFVDSPFDHPRIRREELAGVAAVAAIPASHMLAAKPVLVPADACIAEFVIDGLSAECYQFGVSGLAAAIARILDDPGRAELLSANGRRAMVERWNEVPFSRIWNSFTQNA